VYNLGNGEGHSVRQVIAAVEQASGLRVPVEYGPRRAGDPPVLVAGSARLRAETGWTPRFPALPDIVRTAFTWHQAHPSGYAE